MGVESEANNADIFSGCGNGTLHVSISRRHPGLAGTIWDEGDRHLHICINDEDLLFIASEMFHFVVGRPPEVEKYTYKNWKGSAPQIVSTFPMLNRIDDMYADAFYQADEVSSLREECVTLKTFTSEKSADLGLRKLIYSCDKALGAGISLGLWSD